MKIFSSFFVAILSLTSFATNYSGSGTWQSNLGESGQYNVVVDVEQNDDGVAISQTFTADSGTFDLSFSIQNVDGHFYNVLDSDGDLIGKGYSYELSTPGEFFYHSMVNTELYTIESSIKKTATTICRIGSKTDNLTGEITTWKDMLEVQQDVI